MVFSRRTMLTRRKFAIGCGAFASSAVVNARFGFGDPVPPGAHLPILMLVDAAKQQNAVKLKVMSGRHAFIEGKPSPPIWWCTRARSRASSTASRATRRRTDATSSGGDPVINRRMNVGDAMVFGGGRCRAGVAENDCDENCNFCLAQHFISWSSFATLPQMSCRLRPGTPAFALGSPKVAGWDNDFSTYH